jgi:DNA-binding response OmpR family regulator
MSEAQKCVLLVEDETALRQVLSEKLRGEGFEVIEAKNGEEGLIEAEKHNPDIILLDVIMPRMGGIEMLQKLRTYDWGKQTRVLMLTNLGEAEKIADSLEQNACGFLVKSDWKLTDIVEKVQEVLKNP